MVVNSVGIQEVESYRKYGSPTSNKPHSHLAVSALRSISVLRASQTVLPARKHRFKHKTPWENLSH